MLIRNEIDGVYNGVSQQPVMQKLPNQVSDMVNVYPSIEHGALKRNPSEKINLDSTLNFEEDMYQYEYNRGDNIYDKERYVVNITSAGIEIIDIINGLVLNEANGKVEYEGVSKYYITNYFAGSNGFSCFTVKDTTFVVNRSVTCSEWLVPAPSQISEYHAFIWVKRSEAAYGYEYNWTVENSSSSSSGKVTKKSSTEAAEAIKNNINSGTDMDAVRKGSIVKIRSDSPISVSVGDSYGNTAITAFKDTVSIIEDLPMSFPFEGYVFKVLGSSGDKSAYYYVESIDNVWQETKPKGVQYEIYKSTMPHILVRNADGTFTFKQFSYKNRQVGDEDTNPKPSFVDSKIKDLFLLRNRLCFLTTNGVVMSEINDFSNFYRTTTLSLLDSDRIDVEISSNSVVNLEHALQFENTVLLISAQEQFTMLDTDVLTPSTIAFTSSSSLLVDTNVKPIQMGSKIYLPVKRNYNTSIFELYYSSSSRKQLSNDITMHCPTFVPESNKFVGSQPYGMLFLSSIGSDTIYVNKTLETTEEKYQNAWFKWSIDGVIISIFVMNNVLFILSRRNEAPYFVDDWVLATGYWNMSGIWDTDSTWIVDGESLNYADTFEAIRLEPQPITNEFLDIGAKLYESRIEYGKWVPSQNGNKQYGGNTKWVRAKVVSEEGSEFNITQKQKNRDEKVATTKSSTERGVSVFGDTKDTDFGIINLSEKGFSINTMVFEGRYTQDTRRV